MDCIECPSSSVLWWSRSIVCSELSSRLNTERFVGATAAAVTGIASVRVRALHSAADVTKATSMRWLRHRLTCGAPNRRSTTTPTHLVVPPAALIAMVARHLRLSLLETIVLRLSHFPTMFPMRRRRRQIIALIAVLLHLSISVKSITIHVSRKLSLKCFLAVNHLQPSASDAYF